MDSEFFDWHIILIELAENYLGYAENYQRHWGAGFVAK
jgi:hypothetical protein